MPKNPSICQSLPWCKSFDNQQLEGGWERDIAGKKNLYKAIKR